MDEVRRSFVKKTLGLTLSITVMLLFGGYEACIHGYPLRLLTSNPWTPEEVEKIRRDTTKASFTQLRELLEKFHQSCGVYPTTEQGWMALRRKPLDLPCPKYTELLSDQGLKIGTGDGWGNPIRYEFDGKVYRLVASHDIVIQGP